MKRIKIEGGKTLTGTVKISGAKNSVVALIPAAILCDEKVEIHNIPNISDIDALDEILRYIGAKIEKNNDTLIIDASDINNIEIPENISKKLRASYYFMSALLGKYKKVDMYFPGGCNIGKRPIDQTLKAFRALGASVIEDNNKYSIRAEKLVGAEINLDMPSVGATVNAIYASVRAEGTTVINNAAREPEINNIVEFLNNMGAKIEGAGTGTIKIKGVNYLKSASIVSIPDRIEAGTYVIIGALLGENLRIENIIPEHIQTLLDKLEEANVDFKVYNNYVIVNKSNNLKPITVETKGYPGFATDLQQPLTALLTQCDGVSYLTETIYENRFKNVEYLNKMGSNITINDRTIKIEGKTLLHGCEVTATDLRAGACMVIAGLIAEGTTTINEINHVLRGYENIIQKLTLVGAKIEEEEI